MTKNQIDSKYKSLLQDDSRYFIVTGGRGSGKSYSCAWSILMLTFELDQSVFYTRKTMTSAVTSIIPDFIAVIEEWDLLEHFDITNDKITNKSTGSTITFMGLQTSSGENSAKMKGLSQATVWVLDEAEELTSEDLFDKVNLSIRSKAKQNRIIMIMNPTTKEHFIYERFFEDTGVMPGTNGCFNGVTYIHTTYMDNIEHLDASYLAELQLMQRKAPKQFEHKVLGGWLDKAEGVILSDWVTGTCADMSLVSIFGYDDGFSPDPASLVEVKINRKQKRLYVQEHMYDTQLIETEKCDKISRIVGKNICYADCASPSVIEAMRRRVGQNFKAATKGAGSIIAGIEILRDYSLVVHPDSVNMIKELNNYAWNDKKSGVPLDRWNHLIDALRYVAFMELKQKPVFHTGVRFKPRRTGGLPTFN